MGHWAGSLALVLALALAGEAGAAGRPDVHPYPFLRPKPSRHHLGLTLGMPGMLNIRYEYHLKHSLDGLPAAMIGVDGLLAPTGIGVEYRSRYPYTRLYMTLGYEFISLPRGLIDSDVDIGARVRHAFLAGLELRLGDPLNGRMWVLGGGVWLDMTPEMKITLRPTVGLGVVHRLGGGED